MSDRETSYDVKIWKTEKYQGKQVTSYTVRWLVAGQRHRRPFRSIAAADGFRSELTTHARRGAAFDVETGLPVEVRRKVPDEVSWYDFTCQYIDMKWPAISPKHRKGIAESLITATPVMLDEKLDDSDAKALRSALLNWAYTARRGSPEQLEDVTRWLDWVARHSRPLSTIARPETARAALEALASKLDGTRAAGRTTSVKRANLVGALGYAVEIGLLSENPIQKIKWKAPKSTGGVDRRSVINPDQAATLLDAVAHTPTSGPKLVAFFACMYYAALRPEEAVNLRASWLTLPDGDGWGWMTIEEAAPETGKQWSDTGSRRDQRGLKHRAVGDARRVPVHPELAVILRNHLDTYGTDDDGRLFRGERGAPLAGVTYTRLWNRARRAALSPEVYGSPLARRPYDLRHAAVSTWLNSGVGPSRVAEWAGHSVDVLLKIYAKTLDGQEDLDLNRIHALPATGQRDPSRQRPRPEG